MKYLFSGNRNVRSDWWRAARIILLAAGIGVVVGFFYGAGGRDFNIPPALWALELLAMFFAILAVWKVWYFNARHTVIAYLPLALVALGVILELAAPTTFKDLATIAYSGPAALVLAASEMLLTALNRNSVDDLP
jgi:hypothetical protein